MERLKQKVASSRVFASLSQVASTNASSAPGQPSQQEVTTAATEQPPLPAVVPEAAMSTSWLMAADATAHLTDEEKGILLEVFKKEEQFQRDTIKQLTASRAQLQQLAANTNKYHQASDNKENECANSNYNQSRPYATSTIRQQHNSTPTISRNNQSITSMSSGGRTATMSSATTMATPSSSQQSSRACSCTTSSCGHNTPTTASPRGQLGGAGPRTQSRTSTSSSMMNSSTADGKSSRGAHDQQAANANIGQCRICRKTIGPSEPCHLCSNCNQFICDDCASYSANEQFWMCSSCRRRAMNPAIPAEALKELGLNQNSSAVRRMTLRLNQNDLKMAVNKCSSESSSSSNCSSGPVAAAASVATRNMTTQKSQSPLKQQPTVRSASSGTPIEPNSQTQAEGSQGQLLGNQSSMRQKQQASRRSLNQSSSPAGVQQGPVGSTSAEQQRTQRPPKGYHSSAYFATGRKLQHQPSSQSVIETSGVSAQRQPTSRGLNVATSASGSLAGADSPLKRVNSVQQQKLSAQKTMSQPGTVTSSQFTRQSVDKAAVQQHQQWQEPDLDRATQVRDSLQLQQQQQRRASVAALTSLQQPWGPQHVSTSAVPPYNQVPSYDNSNTDQLQEQPQQAMFDQDHQQQQMIRTMMERHRNSIAAFGGVPAGNQYHGQQQQPMATVSDEQQQPQMGHTQQVDHSGAGSRRDSHQQTVASQLIPVPPEQMHLRRLSDQSNLVRRSSIIANNFLDGTTIARNRSHSNIDTVHYLYQQGQQQQQQPQDQSMFMQQQPAGQYLTSGQQQVETNSYSSATNLYYLQPNVQQQQLQQRRLSDGGQYFMSDPVRQQQQQQQQMSSLVTSYAQKHYSSARQLQYHRPDQSSEELHSDSSSDLDQPMGCGASMQQQPFGAINKMGGQYQTMDYQMDHLQQQQQQPMAIPSVSVSEFAAAAARRSSIHMQQQQQEELNMMMQYQPDNQITPMQINVAIEQVIQHQQQQEQRQLAPEQDPQMMFMMRRGSSGRVLPCIPGGQSRSLLELPLQSQSSSTGHNNSQTSGGQTGGNFQQGQQQTGQVINGHGSSRNGSTTGLGSTSTTLDLPCLSPTIRRASAPEGQNIKIVVDDIDSSSPFAVMGRHAQNGMKVIDHTSGGRQVQPAAFYERHILYRDDSLDPSGNHVGRGFGLHVTGGKLDSDGKLQACITWVLPGGPADKEGLRAGDTILEWDGKCLLDMSYEQVAEVIESSANIAELLVRPTPQRLNDPHQPPPHYVRSQRRLSQQTERDLRRHNQPRPSIFEAAQPARSKQQRRMSSAVVSNGTSAHSSGSSGGRVGTGRRLPQIPGQISAANQDSNNSNSNQLPIIPAARHASTGQLDQSVCANLGNQLIYSHQAQQAGLVSHSGNLLNTNYRTNGSCVADQQQTRSASELHRGSVASLIGGLSQSSVNYQQQPVIHYTGGSGQLTAQGWNTIQPQQYGGSQQTMPTSGGPPISQQFTNSSANPLLTNTSGQDEPSGLIGLQVSVDERSATLEISVLSAHNIDRNPSLDYVVRVRILPESNRFKVCTTQPSSDMNWKETFLFQNFPIQQVHRMALEIGIWVYDEAPRLSAQMAQPICEALIPIQSARERNIDFWPLRPPPTSPQTRRKSLNDLIGNQHGQAEPDQSGRLPSTGYKQTQAFHMQMQQAQRPLGGDRKRGSPYGSQARVSSAGLNDSPRGSHHYRERSSSNRNLQDASKLQIQPRRASDEVATSSSYRLVTRLSPGASRRSISVMNVGDGFVVGSNRLPSSRLGSQASILKTRRDSSQFQLQLLQRQRDHSNSGSPTKYGEGSPNTSSISRISDSQATIGLTPSGRRSSLAGIQSLTGYRSQKNSQSDATEHDSPLNTIKRPREHNVATQQQQLPTGNDISLPRPSAIHQTQQEKQCQRQVNSGPTSTRPSCSSNSNSRRGSSEQQTPNRLQRRGSFATQTLRKLKRTLSLNKGNGGSQSGSNQESRRSSSSSDRSVSELGEDLAVTRTTKSSDTIVGRLKLSFIMTKGQFEVEVICSQGLKFDKETTMGIYVKLYLRGRNKSNKRKTRIVQPCESVVFRQTIKYDGSLVDNKLLEVSVWMKQGNYRGKQPLGLTEIRLADLDMARLQTSWYNLRSMDTLTSSSVDE